MSPDDSQYEPRGARGGLLPSILLCLLFIVGVMVLAACSVSGGTLVDIQAEIDKAVAATMQAGPGAAAATQVSADVATQVAVQVAAMMATQQSAAAPVQQATSTPVPPTPTTQPAEPTPQQAAAASPTAGPSQPPPTPVQSTGSAPTISAEVDTNCRIGPGTGYTVDGYLLQGQTSTVHGRSADGYWWYIANPSKSGQYCWVWTGSTVVQGDTSSLEVVAAPSSGPSYNNVWLYNYGYYYPPYYSQPVCVTKKVVVCKKPNKCAMEKVKVCGGYNTGYYPGYGYPYTCPTCVYYPGYIYPPPVCKPVKPKAGCTWPPPPSCSKGNVNNCKGQYICWK